MSSDRNHPASVRQPVPRGAVAQWLREANLALSRGELSATESLLGRVLANKPDHPDALRADGDMRVAPKFRS